MSIRAAVNEDIDFLIRHDTHISEEELCHAIMRNRVYIIEEDEKRIGWLRYNLFWDNTPFLNMLYILDSYRGKEHGRRAVKYWESQMKEKKYRSVMTSTVSDEYAQHFFVKLGYQTIGGFMFPDEPYEMIMIKEI